MYERDDRSDSFRMIGDIIATIAHNHGIDVDAQTNERWRDVLSLLREFDTLADDSGISHHDALQELASFVVLLNTTVPLQALVQTPW